MSRTNWDLIDPANLSYTYVKRMLLDNFLDNPASFPTYSVTKNMLSAYVNTAGNMEKTRRETAVQHIDHINRLGSGGSGRTAFAALMFRHDDTGENIIVRDMAQTPRLLVRALYANAGRIVPIHLALPSEHAHRAAGRGTNTYVDY